MIGVRDLARIALLIVFLGSGLARLIGTEQQVMEFAALGYPQWLRFVTGLLQVSALALIWFGPARILAATMLAMVSLATLATDWRHGDSDSWWVQLVILAIIAFAAWPEKTASADSGGSL